MGLEVIYWAYLVLLALERVGELVLSGGNAAWSLARGGIEAARDRFPVLALLHVAFFGGCIGEVLWLERPFVPALAVPMLMLALAAQGLRYWAVASLGRRWNVRVIVIPGLAPVTSGPYRYLRHPNYLAVIVEGLAVPLMHTAWVTALVFTLLNGLALAHRIRVEEAAIEAHAPGATELARRPRLVPGAGAGGGSERLSDPPPNP